MQPFRKKAETINRRVLDYVFERRCRGGGYCFYRLEEPNGSDTYHALATLRLLGRVERDDKTATYLRERQGPDGAYESIFQANYCLRGLAILGVPPKTDPFSYIHRHLQVYDVERLPAEVTSIFSKMLTVMDLQHLIGHPISRRQRAVVKDFLFRYRQADRGFGHPYSTLVETSQAVRILSRLDDPLEALVVDRFLMACEDPVFGFVDVPGTTTAFLEHVHAGILLSGLIAYDPRHAASGRAFIEACQNRNGGFSRTTHAGIATLEYTHLAVEAWSLLPGGRGADVICR